MWPAAFAALGLFAYSMRFASAFAIPKLLVFSLGLIPFAAHLLSGGSVNLRRSLLKPALPLLVVMILSWALSPEPWVGLVGQHNTFAQGLLGVAIALAYHIAAASSARDLWSETGAAWNTRGLRLIAAAGAILGVHALAQVAGFDAAQVSRLSGHRAIASIGSPTDLGLMLAMLLPIAVECSSVYGFAVAVGLAASGARGAWIAAAVGLLVYLIRKGGARDRALVTGTVLAACITLAVLFNNRPWAQSDNERVEVWKIALDIYRAAPIIGNGPDSFERSFKLHKTPSFVAAVNSERAIQADAHNDVLQAAATLGTLGLLAYILLTVAALRSLIWRSSWIADVSPIHAAGLGAVVALLVNAKFNPVPLEAMVVAGVIIGSLSTREGEAGERPRGGQLAGAGFAFAAIVLAARLALADLAAGAVDFASLTRATEINPYELDYKSRLINAGIGELNATRNPIKRGEIVTILRANALEAIALRPHAALSWYIAGVEATVEWELKLRERPPFPYYEKAAQLDPQFAPIRAALAQARSL